MSERAGFGQKGRFGFHSRGTCFMNCFLLSDGFGSCLMGFFGFCFFGFFSLVRVKTLYQKGGSCILLYVFFDGLGPAMGKNTRWD